MKLSSFLKIALISSFCFSLIACKEETAEIGKPAPEIATFDLDGNKVFLEKFKGKPILVNFWSSTCGMCLIELKSFEKLAAQHPEKIQLLAINIDGENSDTRKVVEKNKLNLPIVKDQLKITAERYQLVGTPTSFLIDPTGKILYKFEGLIPDKTLQQLFVGQ